MSTNVFSLLSASHLIINGYRSYWQSIVQLKERERLGRFNKYLHCVDKLQTIQLFLNCTLKLKC